MGELRERKTLGFTIRRQYSIGPYVADFYCAQAKLAIEIDGEVHDLPKNQVRDRERDEYFRKVGIQTLRIPSIAVYEDLDGVVERIRKAVADNN